MALCNITGLVYLPSGEPARSRTFVFVPAQGNIFPDMFGAVIPSAVWAKTDRDGFLNVTLLDGRYSVGSDAFNGAITVPDAESATFYEVLGGGGTVPAAPTVVSAPSASPNPVTVGDNVTITQGVYTNATSVTRTLMQGSINRTSQIVDGVWSPGTDVDAVYTEVASGPGGVAPTQTVNITVDEQIVVPPVDLASMSYAYVDADTPHTIVSGEVTAIQTEGTGGLVLGLVGTGSPNRITKVADGFRFTTGRYLTVTGLSANTADGFMLLVDVTFETATGTGQAVNFGTTQARRSSATLQYTVPEWTSPTAQNVGTVTPPQRFVMGIELDQVADVVRYWNPTTNSIETRATTLAAQNPTSLTIGQAMTGIIHKMAVIRRPAGQPLPISLGDAIANFSEGVVTPPTQAVMIHGDNGQSLALGPNSGGVTAPNGQLWRNVLGGNPSIKMLAGLRRVDGAAVTHVAAPLLQRYNLSVPTTGEANAAIGGNIPGGMIVARALLRDGVVDGPIGFQFHGAGGQEVNNFLPGTPIYENEEHWLGQAVNTWGEAE